MRCAASSCFMLLTNLRPILATADQQARRCAWLGEPQNCTGWTYTGALAKRTTTLICGGARPPHNARSKQWNMDRTLTRIMPNLQFMSGKYLLFSGCFHDCTWAHCVHGNIVGAWCYHCRRMPGAGAEPLASIPRSLWELGTVPVKRSMVVI